jgi:hypothetical protein
VKRQLLGARAVGTASCAKKQVALRDRLLHEYTMTILCNLKV